jgi:hypothetical protein
MPLCTIFTKWPAPSGPTCATHAVPSTSAAIEVRIGARRAHACSEPPGMIDGPLRAPSSPPETLQPTKYKPCSASAASRRQVSAKWALPQSTTMSPAPSNGASSSITAPVAGPACTIAITARGAFSDATKSLTDSAGTTSPSCPCRRTSARVRCGERLCTATAWPCRARLRAKLRPITASPVTPMSAPDPRGASSSR